MSTVANRVMTAEEIEAAIRKLPLEEVEVLIQRVDTWLESQLELRPEFAARIEEARADIAAGRVTIHPPPAE